MSLGFREDRRRRRRQGRQTLLRWLLAIGLVGAAGAYAYQTGNRLAARNLASLQQKYGESTTRIGELEELAQTLRDQAGAETARADAWQQRYERDVATGEVKGLFDLVRSKIDAGVSPQRLRSVLEQTENRRDCAAGPQSRRLVVETPLSGSARAQAAFAGGAVTVALAGTPARDAAGNPEAWFDVAKPVTVRLTRPGGKAEETAGPLPLHPSLVHRDQEYRFSIVAGSRGIAEVTMESCRFP